MRSRTILPSLAAGFAAFFIVTVAVTELADAWIEFSLFVGLPAGLLAGLGVAVGVYLGLADDASVKHRRVALAFGTFGVVFLLVVLLATTVMTFSVVATLVAGIFVGTAAGALAYLIGETSPDSAT